MADKNANVRLAEGLHERQLKFAPDQVNVAAGERPKDLDQVPIRAPGVMDEQFPTASLTEYEPKKDKEMVAKLQLGAETGVTGYTPFGKMIAKDEDFKWYQRKQAAAEKADFQRWFAANFDLMSPAQKAWAKEKYPEFYAERKKLLKAQTKNAFRLANLKLHGIEDMDDLKTSYLAETGRLDVGPLVNLMNPETASDANMAATQQKKFVRGLANPFLVFGKSAVGASTVEGRTGQARQFEERSGYPSTTSGLTAGFPAFGNNANQGDANWWTVMRQATSQI